MPPADPNQPGCCGDPTTPCINPPEQSSLGCITSQCDFTTLFTIFMTLLSIIAFGLVLGLKDSDDIFAAMNVKNGTTRALATAISPYLMPLSQDAGCSKSYALTGSFGKLCVVDTVEAGVYVVNISQWVNFRATLYFLAMMGSLIICCLIFTVHRQRVGLLGGGTYGAPVQNPATGAYEQPQYFTQSPPVTFYGTPLYHIFRTVWTFVGLVVFFWICTEMYSFWWFIGMYKDLSTGPLRQFWLDFQIKHIISIVFVFIYLCWPMCNLALEVVMWIIGLLPWCGYRVACAPTLTYTRPPPEMELQDVPCCVRVDMFFVDCNQVKRCGFATKTWEMVTGSKTACLCECCTALSMMGAAPGAPPQHMQMQQMQQGQQQLQPPTTATAMGGSTGTGMGWGGSAPGVTASVSMPAPAPVSATPTRGFPSVPAAAMSVPIAVSASTSQLRTSQAFSAASDDDDVRASKSKDKKKKEKKHKHKSDDEGVDDLRRSKDKEKKKKDKKDKQLRESRDSGAAGD
jgi:hypothetical protein